ncbi:MULTISPECIES: chemotaxis protein [Methylomonas]|uniref:chemotaxis protein n=1 Tax=Methylomonas TaxID=416 RepID=UPI001232D657|nr:chemotaxis protein [Methylomonas rhizoryzae]
MQINHEKSQFIAVASIAAELTSVMEVAKEISLAAANAKAIAFRAGEKAKGFQPITDYINELAKDAMDLVTRIHEHATQLYRMTVSEHRMTYTSAQLQKIAAAVATTKAPYAYSLAEPIRRFEERRKDEYFAFVDQASGLVMQLTEIMYPARAARVIAANSRIEASQAGEYMQSLQAVAESVDNAAQVINDKVHKCRSALGLITNTH